MSYKGDLPVNSRSWQISSHQPAVIESAWWGWEVIDLLADGPAMLTRYLLLKIRNGVRHVTCSQHDRSCGKKGLP
jgi:hypothetical protein